jgi:mono/diheme cytochrome c family protein
MGGGGMATSLIDDTWKFGGSDEVLFKLIKGEIPESTMPKVWSSLEPEQVWKILAYVRSLYTGDPIRADW